MRLLPSLPVTRASHEGNCSLKPTGHFPRGVLSVVKTELWDVVRDRGSPVTTYSLCLGRFPSLKCFSVKCPSSQLRLVTTRVCVRMWIRDARKERAQGTSTPVKPQGMLKLPPRPGGQRGPAPVNIRVLCSAAPGDCQTSAAEPTRQAAADVGQQTPGYPAQPLSAQEGERSTAWWLLLTCVPLEGAGVSRAARGGGDRDPHPPGVQPLVRRPWFPLAAPRQGPAKISRICAAQGEVRQWDGVSG